VAPRHCTPISIKIGQHLLKLCTKVFWCVFMSHRVDSSLDHKIPSNFVHNFLQSQGGVQPQKCQTFNNTIMMKSIVQIPVTVPANEFRWNIQIKLAQTGYSALPSPPRLTRRSVDTRYKRLSGHTHTHNVTAWHRAAQYLRSLSGGEGNDNVKNF